MKLNPKIYIQTAAVFTMIALGLCLAAGKSDLATGIACSSILLMLNLWGWIWAIKTFIVLVNNGGSSFLFTLFTMMKFIVLATTLLAVWYLFGALAVVISNSIIVNALLCPTLYFALQQNKGLSNEF